MARTDLDLTGILVPDQRIRSGGPDSTLATGSYSQAGATAPGASTLTTDTVVGLSGNQAASVYLEASRGGAPDPSNGARLTWRPGTEATRLGWAPPSWARQTTGTTFLANDDAIDAVVLVSGSVLVVSADGNAAVTESAIYDPTDDTWTEGADLPWIAAEATPSKTLIALWQDPDDEVVYCLQTDVSGAAVVRRMLVKSTDTGATWTTVAQLSFSGGDLIDAVRQARWWRLASGDHVLVVFGENTAQSWTSTSGEDWQLVGELTALYNGTVAADDAVADVALLPDGRLLWVYVETADTTLILCRVTDPLQDPATAAAVTVKDGSAVCNGLSIAAEETGRVWLLAEVVSAGIRVYRSLDLSTWLEDDGNRVEVDGGSLLGARWPCRRILPFQGGHLCIWAEAVIVGGRAPMLLFLGGWGSVEPWSVGAAASARDSERLTWGASKTASVAWAGVTANQLDSDLTAAGWIFTSIGSGSVTASADVRTITTTTGVRTYSRSPGATAYASGDSALAFADVAVTSGGSVTADDVILAIDTFYAATTYSQIKIRLTTIGFRVVDVAGATLATVTVDLTARMQFMICIESGNRAEVYYRRPYHSAWISAYQAGSLATTSGGGGEGQVRFGSGTTLSTAQSTWRFVAAVFSTAASSTTAKRDQWRSTGSTAPARTYVLGRPLGSFPGLLGHPASYPSVAGLSVLPTGGASATIEPRYSHPIARIDPWLSPSPRVQWRSTAVTEQIIQWDLDATYSTNDLRYLGIYLAGANFRTAVLEYYTGVTWSTLVSLDLGVATTYAITGDTLQATGSPRWIDQAELVNGAAEVQTSGANALRTIAQNDAGSGGGATTAVRARLEGVDGTESATGTGALVFPIGVAASLTRTTLRQIRLRIPAQATATGDFRLGVCAIGRIYLVGTPLDWGTESTLALGIDEIKMPGYSIRSRRFPPKRRWVVQFAEANVLGLRDEAGGYLSPDGAITLSAGMEGDSAGLLSGLLIDGADTVPVCILPKPPQDDAGSGYTATETRSAVAWWGHLSGAGAWTVLLGDIGTDELYRVGRLTVDEVV